MVNFKLHTKIKSLNVGCGPDTWGDVRIDVAFSFITTSYRPTVLADTHYLPFKDGSFEVVKASHVLEHLKDPFKALDEILRVATKRIILKFPTEWDLLPYFISHILPLSFSALRWAYQTRKQGLHLWIIRPQVVINYFKSRGWKCEYKKGTICLFASFTYGRKAKYFKWLTKHFRIPFEYVILARRNRRFK